MASAQKKERKEKIMWFDINSNEYVSRMLLQEEYEEFKKQQPYEFNYSFEDYINNCLVENNGSLIIVNEH